MEPIDVANKADAFNVHLLNIKADHHDIKWYPYGSMSNFSLFRDCFNGQGRKIIGDNPSDMSVIDIGAADGDVGFFLENLGCRVDFLDNPATNYNDTLGIKHLQKKLNSASALHIEDIDFSFSVPHQYDLALFLGILYHLRNPVGCLTSIARIAERMLLSTRIFSHLPDGTNVENVGVAYFWECRECNNDPTNYWAFSPIGLRRCLNRAGWKILDEFRVGKVGNSDPIREDERMFVYCERVPNWRDLTKHHEF
jgi:hypothetical protein